MTNKIVSQMTLSLGNDTTIEIPIGGGIGGVASATGGSELIIKSIDEAGESRVRKYVLPVDEAEELLIFESGEEGSTESLVLSNGKAIGDYTIAAGQDEDGSVAIAGCKGFFYLSHFGTDVYLSLAQGREEWSDEAQALLDKWDGKKINIVGSHKHTMCSQVIAIAGNCIAVDKLPFGDQIPFDTDDDNKYKPVDWSTLTNPDWDDGAVYCPELPEAGVVRFGRGAKSIGAASVAAGTYSLAEGKQTLAANDYAHAEGRWTKAGYASHAEGYNTLAIGQGAHSEGHDTAASAHSSHAEGKASIASGAAAHAEGWGASASGEASHAEGYQSQSTGKYSHAEGGVSQASGNYSHSEGVRTKATKTGAHSEGELTEANGQYSHAEGKNTIINELAGHVQGKYNLTTSGYAHIVGNGEANKPSDAHRLDWEGNAWFAGDITMKGDKKVASEIQLESKIDKTSDYELQFHNNEGQIYCSGTTNSFTDTIYCKLESLSSESGGYCEFTIDDAIITSPSGYSLSVSGYNTNIFVNEIIAIRLQDIDPDIGEYNFQDVINDGGPYFIEVWGSFGEPSAQLSVFYKEDTITHIMSHLNQSLATKAPAGYGNYGEIVPQLTELTEGIRLPDEAALEEELSKIFSEMAEHEVRRFAFMVDTLAQSAWLATLFKSSANYATLDCSSGFGKRVTWASKTLYNGVWTPWEWQNPPMKVNVEYRTTERYMDEPVYTKLFSIGQLPNTGAMDISHHIYFDENNTPIYWGDIVRCCGQARRDVEGGIYRSSAIPGVRYNWETKITQEVTLRVSDYAISITTNYNASEDYAFVQIWYTKKDLP